MALSFTARLFINNRVLRTERILQSLPKCNVYESAKKYVNAVKKINLENTLTGSSELVQFPFKSFYRFPVDCLKTMIEESLNILKEKGKAKNIIVYNQMMYSLWANKIEFDVDLFLHDIVENKLRINSETFDMIIKCYSREKRIDDIEEVLKKMEKENIQLLRKTLPDVVYAYTVTGQEEKGKEFMKANQVDEDMLSIKVAKMRAYAAIGDTTKLFQLINSFPEINKGFILSDLYRIMSKTNASDFSLDALIGMMKEEVLVETIKLMNFEKFYNKGLRILEQNIENISDKLIYRSLMTFDTPTCPPHIYKNVLDLTLSHIFRVRTNSNVFTFMSFDDALSYSFKASSAATNRILSFSLLNKAVETKSFDNIHEALKFGQTALTQRMWHYMIQTVLIDKTLITKLVKDSTELMSIFTHSQYGLLPDVILYHICSGEFSEVTRLEASFPDQVFHRYATDLKYLVHRLVTMLGVKNFPQVKQEVSKFFTPAFANKLFSVTFVKLLVNDSEYDASFEDDLKSIKELQVKFMPDNISYLCRTCPSRAEVFNSFPTMELSRPHDASYTKDNIEKEHEEFDNETKEF